MAQIHIHLHRPARYRKAKGAKDETGFEHLSDEAVIAKMMQGNSKAKAEAQRRGIDKNKK